jgi:hypothetical protein
MQNPYLKHKKDDNALIPNEAVIGFIEPNQFDTHISSDRHVSSTCVIRSESSGVLHWSIADGQTIKDDQVFATLSCNPIKIYEYRWSETFGVIAERRRISLAKAVLNICIATAKYAGYSKYLIVLWLLRFLAPVYVGAFFYYATKIASFGGSNFKEIGVSLFWSYIVILWAISTFLIVRIFFIWYLKWMHENKAATLENNDRLFGSQSTFVKTEAKPLPFGGKTIPMILFAKDEYRIFYPGQLPIIGGFIAALFFITIYPERLYCEARGEKNIGFEARISESAIRGVLLGLGTENIPPELKSHQDKNQKLVQILHPNSATDAYLLAKEGNIQKLIAYDSASKRYFYQGEYSAIGKKMLFNGKFYDCQ